MSTEDSLPPLSPPNLESPQQPNQPIELTGSGKTGPKSVALHWPERGAAETWEAYRNRRAESRAYVLARTQPERAAKPPKLVSPSSLLTKLLKGLFK